MWSIHKFGGTSVGNADRYKKVAQLLPTIATQKKTGIVVSAMKGTTDNLIDLVDLAKNKNGLWKVKLKSVKDLHLDTLKQLSSPSLYENINPGFESDFNQVYEILTSVELVKSASENIYELISGYGEIWSAQLLNCHLLTNGMKSAWLDARTVLRVKNSSNSVEVLWAESQIKIDAWLKENESVDYLVITGFVASTLEGIATTLKRNGSDYSASIFAYLLKAKELSIWTDVDGVLSADPRLVPEAKVLPELSYQEVIELAYFGAKVVHPGTMLPAMKMGIPIQIRNTFNPEAPGSRICESPRDKNMIAVRGFSIIENMSLINLEGTGMVGVPGVAERLFGALRSEKVNVVLISQASSEHSICFAINKSEVSQAKACIEKCFFSELANKSIEKVDISNDVTILAAVGDGMAHTPGVSGKFLSALGRSGINIRAIAQGSSERNISVVVDQNQGRKALRSVHSSFYLSPYTLGIGIVGTGLIGKTLIRQLEKQIDSLKINKNIDIQIRGVMNSVTMQRFDIAKPIDKTKHLGMGELNQLDEKLDLNLFLDHIAADHIPHYALIDASASSSLPLQYPDWLTKGFHIITPNKKGLSQDFELYKKIKTSAQKSNRHYLYSTNVGAGLPILRTIKDLVDTGDTIQSIEAVLSGTLSFIFNTLKDSFADQVRQAMKMGFTEPDPRDDLSGQDVLRKMTIITREMGLNYENVKPENLVPEALSKISKEDFISRLDEIKIKLPPNQILRYVASWNPKDGINVGLKSYAADHPMAALKFADNILIVHSERYHQQPLIIQGPGAGPDVTAGGVFADILRLLSSLGATL